MRTLIAFSLAALQLASGQLTPAETEQINKCTQLGTDACKFAPADCTEYTCACDHPTQNKCAGVVDLCLPVNQGTAVEACKDRCFGFEPCLFQEKNPTTPGTPGSGGSSLTDCKSAGTDDFKCWQNVSDCATWSCSCKDDAGCTVKTRACNDRDNYDKAFEWCSKEVCEQQHASTLCNVVVDDAYEGKMECANPEGLQFCDMIYWTVAKVDIEKFKTLDAKAEKDYTTLLRHVGDAGGDCRDVARRFYCARTMPVCSPRNEFGTHTGLKMCRFLCDEMFHFCGGLPDSHSEGLGGGDWCAKYAAAEDPGEEFPCTPAGRSTASVLSWVMGLTLAAGLVAY
eukprot:GFYU01005091.1.p1 GENE.GFYU01005091.1~~GFYU01005091.1.p1  ORF type:complete len:340 (-),score=69.49 GFYU01005091.1:53-1072(-)